MKNATVAKNARATVAAATAPVAASVSAPAVNFEGFKAIMVKSEEASKTLFGLRQEAAKWLFSSTIAKGKPTLERHAVLMKLAKSACADLVIKDRNTWSQISACLLVLLEPKIVIETGSRGKNGKGTITLTPASELTTMDSITNAPAQIRAALGASDGRKNNTPKKSEHEADSQDAYETKLMQARRDVDLMLKQLALLAKNRSPVMHEVRAVLVEAGYKLTMPRSKAKLDASQLIPAA